MALASEDLDRFDVGSGLRRIRTVRGAELIDLLAPAVGLDDAQDAVEYAAAKLGIPSGSMSAGQALALLDDIAAGPGLVGISARFAKSRLILGWRGGSEGAEP